MCTQFIIAKLLVQVIAKLLPKPYLWTSRRDFLV
uniref:Uncharacterized protein n=1 Tax=Arundo donax TaxID=35708 RepID=A0A0A9AZ57_ARUDO